MWPVAWPWALALLATNVPAPGVGDAGHNTDIAPRLFNIIPKRITSRTVQEALLNMSGLQTLQGHLMLVLIDCLHIWDSLADFELQINSEDKHSFSLAPDGIYSAKSGYKGLFLGSCSFAHYQRVWKSWAPSKCRFFIWLEAQNKCLTVDRLAKRGLNHPTSCLLCDQEPKIFESTACVLRFCESFLV
jgi:hypothetical protein